MKNSMDTPERRATAGLAVIVAMRMLGLFLIFPVFALYAENLAGVTPLLVGIAVGAYGLTQAVLQIPMGMLSDRIGRKPVIAAGLLLFALGSLVAALSDSIWGVIAGRALQGSGAIAAAVMALAADITRDDQRTKAMAVIGMSIGFAFLLALVLGPVLDQWIGVPGIFWLTAALALVGIGMLFSVIPTPDISVPHRDAEAVRGELRPVLRDSALLRLDFGIMALHMVLTALFLVVPLALRDEAGLESARHWLVYLPVLLISILGMVPLLILGERRGRLREVFLLAVLLLGIAQAGLAWGDAGLTGLFVWLIVFFTGFNVLEATLPSLVSRIAPAHRRGTAMGVYSTSQFAGAFMGGMAGGWMHQQFGAAAVLWLGALVTLAWLLSMLGMRFPVGVSTRRVAVDAADLKAAEAVRTRLLAVPGVLEATVMFDEGAAYLKVDRKRLDEGALGAISAGAA
ncbi:MAG: MFS transporter [Pseudomonadota bacterium]